MSGFGDIAKAVVMARVAHNQGTGQREDRERQEAEARRKQAEADEERKLRQASMQSLIDDRAAQRNAPKAPVFGSSEYEAATDRVEGIRAKHRPPPRPTAPKAPKVDPNESARRRFMLDRITTHMKPSRSPEGMPIPGASVDEARKKAEQEWQAVNPAPAQISLGSGGLSESDEQRVSEAQRRLAAGVGSIEQVADAWAQHPQLLAALKARMGPAKPKPALPNGDRY